MIKSDITFTKVPLWLFPIILYSYFGLSIALVQIFRRFGPPVSAGSALRWFLAPQHAGMLGFAITGTLVAGVVWLWLVRSGDADRALPFAKPYGRYWLWASAALIANLVVGYLLLLFVNQSWSAGIHLRSSYPYDPAMLALVAVGGVVVGPVCEEILFRGFGMGYLTARGYNRWLAGGITMILFVLQHWPIYGFEKMLILISVSIFITVFRIVAGNLTPGLILHMLNNAIALLVMPMLYVQVS